MAQSSDDISKQIRNQLKIVDPDLSAEPGTPERKIIDTVAEVIADSQSDQFVLQYQLDIDTKVGTDLDKFVALFGFARQGGNRAIGTVTFSTATAAVQDTVIPIGTSVLAPATSVTPSLSFVTTANVVLYTGTTSVNSSIESVNIGLAGNVPARTITQLGGSATTIITSVSNPTATSGGTEIETDAELRVRFKNTIFRNVAGTNDQYLALAISSQFTNKANVIGPISRYVEYLQVPPSLILTSQIPYSKFTYNFDYYLTQTSVGPNEIFFTPNVDYSFAATAPPSITILAPDATRDFTTNSVLLLEHTYCSANSRNIPASGINNYVDVYVDGVDPETAVDSLIFPNTTRNFTSTSGTFFARNFLRVNSNQPVVTGNRFQPLLWQPVYLITSGTPITIQGNTFFEGQDYWFIKDTTLLKGSKRAANGLEWGPNVTNVISSGTTFQVAYQFNELIITLNELMDAHKQITTDVLVHAANRRYFNINLIAVYTPGFSPSAVNSNISTSLTTLFQKLQFGPTIQISDILEIAHEVPGVDNVRLARAGDGVAYGIQEYAPDGITQLSQPNTADFSLQDSDIAVLNQVVVTRKSGNTFVA